MSTIHLHQTTTATPEQFVAGLTDFGPGRSKLFPNSADDHLRVHQRSPHEADVTEGSGGIWERLHYDWSDPNRVVMTTTDSNIWGGASGHTYAFTRRPDGRTDVDAVVVREGKNLNDGFSDSCSGPSAEVFWRRRFKAASMPSRRATPEPGPGNARLRAEDGRSLRGGQRCVDGTLFDGTAGAGPFARHWRPR